MKPQTAARVLLTVQSAAQLRALMDPRPWRRPAAPHTLRLTLPGLPEALLHDAERRLNRWSNTCGCSAGASALLAAVIAQVIHVAGGSEPLGATVLKGCAWALCAGLAGKAAAVAGARLLFAVEAARLLRALGRATRARVVAGGVA